jgi:hypothetical protein
LRERRERRDKEGKGRKRKKETIKTIDAPQAKSQAGTGRSSLADSACARKSRREKEGKEGRGRERTWKTYQLHFPTNSCNKQDFPNPGWEVMTTVFTISVFISGDLSTKVFFWEMDIWPGSVQSAGGGEMDITCSRVRRRARISLSRPTRFLVGLGVRRREKEGRRKEEEKEEEKEGREEEEDGRRGVKMKEGRE